MPKLIYQDPETGQEHVVEVGPSQPEVTIGRNPGNIVRVNNPSISRKHARVVWENGQCQLVDLNSSNGSYVNGTRIQAQVLVDGDRVRVGEFAVDFVDDVDDIQGGVAFESVEDPLQVGFGDRARPQTDIGGFAANVEPEILGFEQAPQSGNFPPPPPPNPMGSGGFEPPPNPLGGNAFEPPPNPMGSGGFEPPPNPMGGGRGSGGFELPPSPGGGSSGSGGFEQPNAGGLGGGNTFGSGSNDPSMSDFGVLDADFQPSQGFQNNFQEGAAPPPNALDGGGSNPYLEPAGGFGQAGSSVSFDAHSEAQSAGGDPASFFGAAASSPEESGFGFGSDDAATAAASPEEIAHSLGLVSQQMGQGGDDFSSFPVGEGGSGSYGVVGQAGELELEQMRQDYEALGERLRLVEQERDELRDALDNAGSAGGATQLQIERLRKERDRLSDEKLALDKRVESLESQLAAASDDGEADVLRQEVDVLRAEVDEARSTIEARHATINELEGDVDRLESELEQARDAASGAVSGDQVEAVKAELALAQDNLRAFEEKYADAQFSIEDLRKRLDTKTDEFDRLSGNVESSEGAVADLHAELSARQTRIDELEANLEHERHERASLEQRLGEVSGELASRPEAGAVAEVSDELDRLREQIAELTLDRDTQRELKEAAQEEVEQVHASTRSMREDHERLAAERDRYRQEVEGLQASTREMTYLRDDKRKLSAQVEELRAKAAELERGDRTKRKVFADLKAEIEKLLGQNNLLEDKVGAMEDQLSSRPSNEQMAEQLERVTELETSLSEARSQVEDLDKERSELTQGLGALDTERSQLAEAKASLETEIEQLRASVAEGADAQDVIADLHSQLSDRDATIATLEAEVSELETRRAELETSVSAGGETADELREQIALLVGKHEELEAALQARNEEFEALEAEKADLQRDKTELEAALAEAGEVVGDAPQGDEALLERIDSLEQELEKRTLALSNVIDEKDELEERLRELS